MILICGGLADTVTELVCARLRDCGYSYRLLDLGTYPAGFKVNWRWQGTCPTGYIASGDWRLDLDELRGVYVRYLGPEGRLQPPNLAPEFAEVVYSECDTGLAALLECLPCTVVNRLTGDASNRSKPYQALCIRRCGLLTPPTLVTSDPEAARQFYEERQGQVIFKSISGVRSIVRGMNVLHLARLPLLQHGPAQFQAYIPGDNVRVHTVGDRWFATRIRSMAIDYRYAERDGFSLQMEPTTLPPAVAAACLRVARQLGLLLAGIDLKETPEGDFYCFEVNPSPAFLYYEQHTHQPISSALAALLHEGCLRNFPEEDPGTSEPDSRSGGLGSGLPRFGPTQ
jgi:glutathione synthase/RimK-type ligase-like ATP-grasp enzyme